MRLRKRRERPRLNRRSLKLLRKLDKRLRQMLSVKDWKLKRLSVSIK